MSKMKSKKDNSDMEEEIKYEPEVSEGNIANAEKQLKKVKKELQECQKLKQEYLDGWQRSKADFINAKKRSEEDKKAFTKYANEEFILELLPALDSFDQAFKDKESWDKVDKNWRTGIEFIHSQLVSILNNHGVTEISPLGEEFDPQLHHSIEMIEVEEKEDDGRIVDVTQKGYKLGEKIIRHASVKVGKINK